MPVDQLRASSYHQQLGRKICASYIAQQQGIGLETALKKLSGTVGDLWLILAEVARLGYSDDLFQEIGGPRGPRIKSVM